MSTHAAETDACQYDGRARCPDRTPDCDCPTPPCAINGMPSRHAPIPATCPDALCAERDPSGRYSCNLRGGHGGAHMELTDRHSVAWGWTFDA